MLAVPFPFCVSAGRLVGQERGETALLAVPMLWCGMAVLVLDCWLRVHVLFHHCRCDWARVAVMVSCCGHNRW